MRTTREAVVDAAMGLLDDSGWSAVTLRAVARRLGVHVTSVVFQVDSKERLRELMADRVFGELGLDGLPSGQAERVVEICHRLRRALLTHRDGAVLVTGTDVWDENTLAVSDVVVGALLDVDVPPREAAHAALCLEYLVLGLVQEEQGRPLGDESPTRPPSPPALARVSAFVAEDDFEARLDFGARGLVAHALGHVGRTSPRAQEG